MPANAALRVALVDAVENPSKASPLCSQVVFADLVEDPLQASPLCSHAAPTDSVEDPLEASPLCSKAALADSVEDPLEASPLCCEVPLADSLEHILREHHLNEASVKKHFDANFHPAPARKIDSLGSKQFCMTMTPQARNSASESGSGTSSVSFRV